MNEFDIMAELLEELGSPWEVNSLDFAMTAVDRIMSRLYADLEGDAFDSEVDGWASEAISYMDRTRNQTLERADG